LFLHVVFALPNFGQPTETTQWGPTNRFNNYLKTGNSTTDGYSSVYPDYTNQQTAFTSTSQLSGQIGDFSRLNPLSQIIQQSYIPTGDLLPGSDFLGVVSSLRSCLSFGSGECEIGF
jgi:hypothetical protein